MNSSNNFSIRNIIFLFSNIFIRMKFMRMNYIVIIKRYWCIKINLICLIIKINFIFFIKIEKIYFFYLINKILN